MPKIVETRYQQRRIFSEDLNISNKSMRIPIWFCVESSEHIILPQVKDSMKHFLQNYIYDNLLLRSCAEIGISVYAAETITVKELGDEISSGLDELDIDRLSGKADIGNAVLSAVKKLEERKRRYRIGRINYYQPTVFILSGGESFGDNDEKAKEICRLKSKEGSVSIVPFCNRESELLRAISSDGKIYPLEIGRYDAPFELIRASMERLSHSSSIAFKSLVQASKGWNDIRGL